MDPEENVVNDREGNHKHFFRITFRKLLLVLKTFLERHKFLRIFSSSKKGLTKKKKGTNIRERNYDQWFRTAWPLDYA
jgi:hypothetical protein